MTGLPRGWGKATLQELCSVLTDGTHHSPPNGASGDFKYITAKNIKPWGLDLSSVTYIDASTHAEIYRRCSPAKGDVLYIKDGATTGIAALNPLDEQFSLLSSVALLRPHQALMTSEYLVHYLNSPDTLAMMLDSMSGSAIRRLTLTTIGRQLVVVPPLAEQRRIVAKIDSLAGKSRHARDHLDHIPRLVEKYKQAILAAAFRGDLTRAWREAHQGVTSAGQIAEQLSDGRRLRWLREAQRKAALRHKIAAEQSLLASYEKFDGPEAKPLEASGWFQVAVGSFAIPLGGKRLPKGAEYVEGPSPHPYIRVTDFAAGRLDTSALRFLSPPIHDKLAQYCVEAGDVCISIAGTIGATFVVPKSIQGANLTENAARLIVAEEVLPSYLDLYLKSANGQAQIISATVATGQPKLALFRIEQLLVPLCDRDEQAQVVMKVNAALAWIDRLTSEATSARKLIDRLGQAVLAKAFRGELVAQDAADEPANALLERIKAERDGAPKQERRSKN